MTPARLHLAALLVLATAACGGGASTGGDPSAGAIDGRCGAAGGAPAASAPTTSLCSAGTPSTVTGTGPFRWSCAGASGGATAQCSAPLAGAGPFPASGWVPLKLGGGGWITGQSISSAGVRFARTDIGGAYLWGTDHRWHQVVTQASMPARYFGYFPANTSANQVLFGGGGVMEIAACPGDATCAYMLYAGRLFVSTSVDPADPGRLTWSDTGFSPIPDTANLRGRNSGPFVAVDPHDRDHVLVGTQESGVRETFDGTATGGATWTTVPTSRIPLAAVEPGTARTNYRIAFDPTSSTVPCPGLPSTTCTSKAYVWTSGGSAPGVYATADAGATWARTSGGPASVNRLKVSGANAGGGQVWATDDGGYVWRYAGGAWTQLAALGPGSRCQTWGCQAVAINPLHGDHVAVLLGNGYLYVSTDGSASAPTFDGPYAYTLDAVDAPWQGRAIGNRGYLGAGGDIDFDPLQDDVLVSDGGQGIWTTTLPGASFTWTSIVDGVEELIYSRIAVAAPGKPSIGGQDESGCQFDITHPGNPRSCFPAQELAGLYFTSGLSIAPGTNFMVAKMSQDFGADGGLSGYSTDGFQSDYTPFNTWNAKVASTAVASGTGNAVRVTVSSTAGLVPWSNGTGSIVCSLTDLLTSDLRGGSCHAARVVDATHLELVGSQWNTYMSTPGYRYVFFAEAAPLDDWNGALNVVSVTSSGGRVRVTVASDGYLGNDHPICISGVQMTGATVVNGCWLAANVQGASADLGPSSTFQSGDAYRTGGTLRTWGNAGGSIAAASTTNWTVVGADRVYPQCTADAGAHWSTVQVPGVPVALTTVTSATTSSVTVADVGGVNGSYQIFIPLASGRVFTDTGPHYSGNTITFTHPVPPGDGIQPGAAVSNSTGWPFAAYLNSHPVVADAVEPNTFFAMNSDVGLARWTQCGPVTVVAQDPRHASFLGGAGFNDTLKAVPGEAGHLFWTAGPQGSTGASHPAATRLWRTCDATSGAAATLSIVPGFYEPISIGFGAAKPGADYPAIYVVGWYSPTDRQSDAVYGIWRSTDDLNHLAAGACAAGNSWTSLGDYPTGWQSFPMDIEGDPFVFGPVYFAGSYGAFTATVY